MNLPNCSHPERSERSSATGAQSKDPVSFTMDVPLHFHGILRLRYVRLSASAPLRMTAIWKVHPAPKITPACHGPWDEPTGRRFHICAANASGGRVPPAARRRGHPPATRASQPRSPPIWVKVNGLLFQLLDGGDHVVERCRRWAGGRRLCFFFKPRHERVVRLHDEEEDHRGHDEK